jgi:hypothetical protein
MSPDDGGKGPVRRAVGPVVVHSREELVRYLKENPIQLKAGRGPLPPRVGSPDFVGPVHPWEFNRPGRIGVGPDGVATFEIRKKASERARDEWLLRFAGME